jgi:hypothetical protein
MSPVILEDASPAGRLSKKATSAYVVAFIKDPKLAGMLVSLTPAYLIMSLLGGYFATFSDVPCCTVVMSPVILEDASPAGRLSKKATSWRVYIGIAYLVLIYIYVFSWNLTGERLAQRLREKYFYR